VLLNVVINARDAMPNGGRLLIETANTVFPVPGGTLRDAPLTGIPAGEYVALIVTDTGEGMAPDVIARAFDPFYTTKPIGQGTGLGLSMIHGFVQQSGGHVFLHSEPGQGTTVTVKLPRYRGDADPEGAIDPATKALAETASGVVLIVEDEPVVRMVIFDALSDLGYTVLEADDGRAGLLIAQTGVRIDLLLTDVGLPGGINGRQLADAVRQSRPCLKVLFVTGYAEAATVDGGQLETGMEVMTKPFTVEALVAKVQGMISD
jgi:CheY-like chemotaxis protein